MANCQVQGADVYRTDTLNVHIEYFALLCDTY